MEDTLFRKLYYYGHGNCSRVQLFNITKDNLSIVQRLQLEKKLKVHNGCVNTVCWDESGQVLLSGSDDRHLVITNPYTEKVLCKVLSGHHANIFSAKFLPNSNNKRIVSCSGDGLLTYTDLEDETTDNGYNYNSFDCHFGTIYQVVVVPGDSNSFLSCGEDGTVRWYDLRVKDRCVKPDCTEDVLINCRRAVTALAVNWLQPYQLAVGCADGSVVLYDRRKLATKATGGSAARSVDGMLSRFAAPFVQDKSVRITSLAYSACAQQVLVNYSTEKLYLFNIKENEKPKKFETEEEALAEAEEEGGNRPPIKRLRLRGDWSDTGPNAVPERLRGQSAADNTAQSVMQRMSDMLTRWLEDAADTEGRSRDDASQPSATAAAETEQADQGEPVQARATVESEQGEPVQANATAERDQSEPVHAATNVGVSEGEGTQVATCVGSADTGIEHREASDGAQTTQAANLESMTEERACRKNVTSDDDSVTKAEIQRVKEIDFAAIKIDNRDKLDKNEDVTFKKSLHSDEAYPSTSKSDRKTKYECDNQAVQSSSDLLGESSNSTDLQDQSPREASTSTNQVSVEDSEIRSLRQMVRSLKSQSIKPRVSLNYSGQGASTGQICFSFPHRSPTEQLSDPPTEHNTECHEDSSDTGTQEQAVDSEETENQMREIGSTSNDQNTENIRLQETLVTDKTTCTQMVENNEQVESTVSNKRSDTETEGDHGPLQVAISVTDSSSKPQTPMDGQNAKNKVETPPEDQNNIVSNEADPHNREAYLVPANNNQGDEPGVSARVDKNDNDTEITRDDSNFGATSPSKAAHADKSETDSAISTHNENTETPSVVPTDSQTSVVDDSALTSTTDSSLPATGQAIEAAPETSTQRSEDDWDFSDSDDEQSSRPAVSGRGMGGSSAPARSSLMRSLEQNLAARRLQRVFRRRQEQSAQAQEAKLQLPGASLQRAFSGHRNARTMIKQACFWGRDFILSGSDCGHVFVWDRHSGRLVKLLEADAHVVNCIQPHPFDPVLATSGIDYDIKLWGPSAPEPSFDELRANQIVERNRLMLEETHDTLTVPATFMLRMLASINRFRAARSSHAGSSSDSD